MKIPSDFVFKLTRFPLARWSPIPLRLIVGYGFMQHGLAKLSRGPDTFAAILHTVGVPDPHLMAWLTILTELVGGLSVLLGAFVTVVSVPMTAVLLVAMFEVHLPYGFSSIKLLAVTATGAKFGPVGYEVILLYLSELSKILLQKPLEPKFGRQDPSQELSLVRRELVHPRDECLCEFIHGGELIVRGDRCFGLAPQLVHDIEFRTLLGKPQQFHLIVGGEL
jgi:putative oxidoreductase